MNCRRFPDYVVMTFITTSVSNNKKKLYVLRVQSTRCDFSQFIYFCKTLYMFQTVFPSITWSSKGTAVAQWLRCCATNREVAGSIPAGVSGVFIDIKSFRSHYGPGVDSASNRNEYQEYFLLVKAAGA